MTAKDGYKSAKQFGYEASTSQKVWQLLTESKFRAEFGAYYELSKDYSAKAQELIEFAKNFQGESAYAENLRATASLTYQTYKTVGLFISAIIAKQKAEEQEIAKASAKVYKSEQYAPTGERVEIEVKALSSRVIESDWGSSTLWTFESGDYKFKWFDSGYTFGAEIGEVFKIKATVKGLDEYQGQFATKLSRVVRVKAKELVLN